MSDSGAAGKQAQFPWPMLASLASVARKAWPGFLLCAALGVAAQLVGDHVGGPPILWALGLGIVLHRLSGVAVLAPGFEFVVRQVLRLGVGLLGIRITFGHVAELGAPMALALVALVALTVALGLAATRAMRLPVALGLLTASATAICGASAAIAIAAALPAYAERDRDMTLAVVGTAALSTVAMVAYPPLAAWLGLDPLSTGVFLGGSIHDVAQVVGAGYSVSPQVGDTATIVKLWRVALLFPVVVGVALWASRSTETAAGARRPPVLPWFLVLFSLLVVVNSIGLVPATVRLGIEGLSRWLILFAMVALGFKTSLVQMARMGARPAMLLVFETVVVAGLALAAIKLVY